MWRARHHQLLKPGGSAGLFLGPNPCLNGTSVTTTSPELHETGTSSFATSRTASVDAEFLSHFPTFVASRVRPGGWSVVMHTQKQMIISGFVGLLTLIASTSESLAQCSVRNAMRSVA